MRIGSSAVVCLVVFGACQSAPPPVDPLGDGAWRERVDQQLLALSATFAVGARDALFTRQALLPAPESAAASELAARLATLTRRLDDVIARLPVAAEAGPAEASATAAGPAKDAVAGEANIRALQAALTVLDQQRMLLVDNIANVQTPGYRRCALVTTTEVLPGTDLQLPKALRVERTMTPGVLEITQRNLDVAIDGDGFFAMARPDGSTAYTRDGNLQVSADGRLVFGSGCALLPTIVVPNDTLEISIDPEGRVNVRTASRFDTLTALGQIQLHRFRDASSLAAVDGNALQPSATSGAPTAGAPGTAGFGLLKQGFLERSNVQMVHELVNLQLVERHRAALVRCLADQGVYVR